MSDRNFLGPVATREYNIATQLLALNQQAGVLDAVAVAAQFVGPQVAGRRHYGRSGCWCHPVWPCG